MIIFKLFCTFFTLYYCTWDYSEQVQKWDNIFRNYWIIFLVFQLWHLFHKQMLPAKSKYFELEDIAIQENNFQGWLYLFFYLDSSNNSFRKCFNILSASLLRMIVTPIKGGSFWYIWSHVVLDSVQVLNWWWCLIKQTGYFIIWNLHYFFLISGKENWWFSWGRNYSKSNLRGEVLCFPVVSWLWASFNE